MNKQPMNTESGKLFKSVSNYRSQWDAWGDNEWLILYIGQIWAERRQFPSTQAALDAIDLNAILAEFARFKAGKFSIQIRGITLEESWIATTVLSRQFHVCLKNALEYWPPDRIPPKFKKSVSPNAIWRYVYGSINVYYQRLGQHSDLPEPFGTLGVFLGNCAHAISVIGIDRNLEKILFRDPWEKGPKQSLLAKGQNGIGLQAVREDKNVWSITKEEFEKSVLNFTVSQSGYIYYAKSIADGKFQAEIALTQ